MDAGYQRRLLEAALTGEQFRVRDGAYVRWAPGAGVELWLQLRERDVIGLAPHFAGDSVMPVALTQRVRRPEDSSLAGGMHAWANAFGETPESGDYPFVFEQPDAGRFAGLTLPTSTVVQLAAFGHDLRCFSDEATFDGAQAHAELKYAPESFVPSGLFLGDQELPSAHAMFTGRVLRAEQRVNPFAGGTFWAVRVRTLGGEVDVVADPAAVTGHPVADGILQGSFWLSGRLPSTLADADSEFWSR